MLMMSPATYGAVSDDVYVRKDVFDAKMEAFMKEIRGEFQVMNAKLKALSRRVDDNYQKLDSRISELRDYMLAQIGGLRKERYGVSNRKSSY